MLRLSVRMKNRKGLTLGAGGERYSVIKSNSRPESPQGSEERTCRIPHRLPDGAQGRNLGTRIPWVSSLKGQENKKGENDAGLQQSAILFQSSWGKNCHGQGRELGIAVELQEKVNMAEPVMLPGTTTLTGELTDKYRDCHSSSTSNISESVMFQSAGEAVKELLDVVVPKERDAKHEQKCPPKKNMHYKTQVRPESGDPPEPSGIQTCDYFKENCTYENSGSGIFSLSKENMKDDDKSLESIKMDSGINKGSCKTDARHVDTHVSQIQPSASFTQARSVPVTRSKVSLKKKMGRPKKKCRNIVTKRTFEVLGTDCTVSGKEPISSEDQNKKASDKSVRVQKEKRGRGKYIRKPVCISPSQEKVVGTGVEKIAETRSPPRTRDSVSKVIEGKLLTGTECKTAFWDLEATSVRTPVQPLPDKKNRCHQKKTGLNKKTCSPFERQNCSVSQEVKLPTTKIGAKIERIDSNEKATSNEKKAVGRQHYDADSIVVTGKNRVVGEKFKRKIGRPFKKKTLIKMAKQLALAQARTANAPNLYEDNHCENISLPQSPKYKLKRERQNLDLHSSVLRLRRYDRACKSNANCLAEKQEQHPTSSDKSLLSSVCNVTIPQLESKEPVSPSSDIQPFSKSSIEIKGAWKKRKHLKNKRKCERVNMKDEKIQEPVSSAFPKMQKSSGLQESKSIPSAKGTSMVSDAVSTTKKKALKNWKMRSKAKKIDQLRSNKESGPSLCMHSSHHIYNEIAPRKVASLILKADLEGTAADKAVTDHKGTRCSVSMQKVRKSGLLKKKMNTKVKYESVQDVPSSNVSESYPMRDSRSKLALSPNLNEAFLSGDTGPRRRGRPCKNKAVIPAVKSSELKTEMEDYESLAEEKSHPPQGFSLQPPGKVVSHLKIMTHKELKKPRKVDRRRKRYRLQKAQELKALSGGLMIIQESVGQLTPQIDKKVDVRCISQIHSNKRKLETDDRNDSEPLTKRPRKASGSKKRRRRKRSWWDDRGKCKDKDVLTEKFLDTSLNPSLQISESKADVAVPASLDYDVKMTPKEELITSNECKMQSSNEHPPHPKVVPQISGPDGIFEQVECSKQISPSNALSTVEMNTEMMDVHQGNSESLKNAAVTDRIHNISISKNQRLANNPETEDNEKIVIKNSGPLLDSCKITVDFEPDELHEQERSYKTMTYGPQALEDKVSMLETGSPVPDDLRPKSESGSEDQQKQIVLQKGNVLRDNSVMFPSKEADKMEMDVEIFTSSKSKTLNLANSRSSKTLDYPSEVLSNSPDVEMSQPVSSPQQVLVQDLPPGEKEQENCRDGEEQSDAELDKSMTEIIPEGNSSEDQAVGDSPRGKKPIECQFCGRLFHHISAYIIHRRVHTGERPYSCQECGKSFAQLSNLNAHRKIHKIPGDLRGTFSYQKTFAYSPNRPQGLNRKSLPRLVDNGEDRDKNQHCSLPHLYENKPHICSVCGKGFRYSSMLKIHMRVHSGEKPYSCKVCGKSFSQACSVSVHEKIHWSVKPYVCNLCGKGFSQLGTLRTHFYSHTGVYKKAGKRVHNKVTFQCRTCNKCFDIWHQYNLHLKSHIDAQRFASDTSGRQNKLISNLRINCQSYGKHKSAKTVHNLHVSDTLESEEQKCQPSQLRSKPHLHIQSNHPNHPQDQLPTVPLSFCTSPQLATGHKTFLESMNLKSKKNSSQQGSRSRQVAHSAYSQILKSTQKYPLRYAPSVSIRFDRKFDPRKYLCPRCGRLFRHLGRLRAHMLTHVHGHSYTCGRCGKMLENWNKFWLHQHVHRQKRGRFFCPKCGQGFRFAGIYKQHLKMHKEPGVFPCSLCPQTFSHRETMKAHLRDQHKPPHKCNVCGKSFHLQINLQRHSLVHRHTHPECCPLCSWLFPSVTGLQDHMMIHKSPTVPLVDVSAQQNLLPYQCGECEASFKNLDLLFRHQLCHSPPKDKKPWRKGEIVGLQKKSPYALTSLDDTSVCPSTSSTISQVAGLFRNPSSHQQGSLSSGSHSPDSSSNKPSHQSNLHSLNNLQLPQTQSPTTAVPFSESPTLGATQCSQGSASVPPASRIQVQTSPKSKKMFPQKPLRTYEKSKRSTTCAPSSVKPLNEEGCVDGLECAECGATFTLVPELYEHYLQHARGEL